MSLFINWFSPKKLVIPYEKPVLKITRTIVPKEYQKRLWDSHLYMNQIFLTD